MLDFRAQTIHNQSAPANAGTKQLAVHETALTFSVTSLELSMFVLIVLLVCVAMRRDWHDRSIEYRLLAELCRKQQVLAPLGRAISLGDVRGTDVCNRAQWVKSYFEAFKRAAPLPTGEISKLLQEFCDKSVLRLIDGQLRYHSDRGEMARKASRFFAQRGAQIFSWGAFLVFLKVVVTLWKCVDCTLVGLIIDCLAIILAGLSAAFFGIRSYAELELLDEQSSYMLSELKLVKHRIEGLDLQHPMASQDLGSDIDAAAKFMLLDLEGWERLFRGKILEAHS